MPLSKCKQWIGPLALGGSLYLFCATDKISFLTAFNIAFTLYVTGIIPVTVFFPPAWYRPNIFGTLYRLYCSDGIGYTYLRPRLHPRQRAPHSDFRPGVRALSGPVDLAEALTATEKGRQGEKEEEGEKGREGEKEGEGEKGGGEGAGVVVVPVPCLADNYAYLVLSFSSRRCAAVDPADPDALLAALRGVRARTGVAFVLTDVLTTHRHWDHAGGNRELRQRAAAADDGDLVDRRLRVIGSARDRPHACTEFVRGGDEIAVAGGAVRVAVLRAPGHTSGSVLFLAGDARGGERVALFTGDCIFCGGCGAMFEVAGVDDVLTTWDTFAGKAVRTHPATKRILDAENVLCYVGHEYTERLLDESLRVIAAKISEPGSKPSEAARKYYAELRTALTKTSKLRFTSAGALPACTVPSTLAVEHRTNALLTLQRQVLEDMRNTPNPGSALSSVIYTSLDRVMPP